MNLEKEAIDLSKYVYITDEVSVNLNGSVINQTVKSQLETFSPYIADLLVRCCIQIESISKEIYFENGGQKNRDDNNIFFDEDCLKLIDKKWGTHSKVVMVVAPFFNLTEDVNRMLKPLKNAHKRQGTYWEKAYQAVKHDRFLSLPKGNIKAFLHALAALYLLNIYYRNEMWISKYQDISKIDYSMGSAIFAVKSPETNQLWYSNTPIISESPYVVRYKDEDFERIEKIQQDENKALNDYWNRQPEIHEDEFVKQLNLAYQKGEKVMKIWELSKYRLNKKIPATLSFIERKELLVNSAEWNGWIHKNNNHLSEDELTEENIQKEIDIVGTLWGMEIMKQFQKLEWISIAFNSEICKIYIPENTELNDEIN